jgi:N-sulfoglucosamine sulfohydrolase
MIRSASIRHRFSSRWSVFFAVAAGVACGWVDRTAAAAAPPNVLFIIADDASPHFGCYGCRWAKTPNIDALAARGIVFDAAYVPTSKCAPCRAGLLTGRYPWQLEEAANHQCTFPARFTAFSEVLAARGVTCGKQGKVWGPGVALTADGQPRTWGLENTPFQKFLAEAPADKPFFFWYGSSNPHRAYTRDAGLAAGKKPADIDRVPAFWPDNELVRRDMLDYATEIEAFDREVGELVTTLRESGRLENTLVIVTSDHGMPFPRVKGHTFELAHRVPLVASWPAGIVQPGRRCDRLVSIVDLAPTFLELSGVPRDSSGMAAITGKSLVDLLRAEKRLERPFVLVGRERNDIQCRPGTPSGLGYPARGIRQGRWLYVHNFAPDRWPCGDPDVALADTDDSPTKQLLEQAGPDDRFWQFAFGKRPADELYDVEADPDCVMNLAADSAHATEVERLRSTLMAELRRQEDPRVVGDGDIFDRYVSPAKPRPRNR